MKDILYSHALDDLGNLVNVSSVNPSSRGGPYFCLSCGSPMIPRLGAIKAHHFAHSADFSCSGESYLHALGKRCFVDGFKAAQALGIGMRVPRDRQIICSQYEKVDSYCFDANKSKAFVSLVPTFDTIKVEASYREYVIDILLSDSKSDRVLAVEIAVTHQCEEVKKASGFKILEIPIKSESDAFGLLHGVFPEFFNLFNWSDVPVLRVPDFSCQNCPGVDVFIIHQSGKPYLYSGWKGQELKGKPIYKRFFSSSLDSGFLESRNYRKGIDCAKQDNFKVYGQIGHGVRVLPQSKASSSLPS